MLHKTKHFSKDENFSKLFYHKTLLMEWLNSYSTPILDKKNKFLTNTNEEYTMYMHMYERKFQNSKAQQQIVESYHVTGDQQTSSNVKEVRQEDGALQTVCEAL